MLGADCWPSIETPSSGPRCCACHAGARLLAGQANPSLRAALTEALAALTATNGVVASADRANRRRFRANLGQFVASARSIVRTQ